MPLAYDYLPIQRLSSRGWSAALSLEAVPKRLKPASLLLFVLNPAGLQQQFRSPSRTHGFSLQSFNLMQFVLALLLLLLISQCRRPVTTFSDNLSIIFSSTIIINYPTQTFPFSLCPINSINAIILFKVFMPLFFILLEPFLYSTYTKVYTSLKHHLIFYRCSPA